MCKRFFYLGFTLALFWSSAFVLAKEPAAKADHSWLNGTWEFLFLELQQLQE
jgi:hypothetical protein